MTISFIILLAILLIVLRNGMRRIVRSLIAIAFIVLFLGDRALSEINSRLDLPAMMASVPWWHSAPGPAATADFRLRAGEDGQFRAQVLVAGAPVRMLVDTGATITALTYRDAQRLGLVHEGLEFSLPITTANGDSHGAPVRIPSLRVGGIERHKVQAVITLPGAMHESLLGMNFLNSLSRFEVRAGELALVN